MLLTYSYMTKDGAVFGDYQCDVEDFKKFFANKRIRKDLYTIFVKLPDKFAMWTAPKGTLFDGWQVVDRTKKKKRNKK